MPHLNIIYNGGVGSDLPCTVHSALDISKTYYDGFRFANVQSIDHMAQTDLSLIVESLVKLIQRLRTEEPDVPIVLAGHSLGTGLIVQAATKVPVDGLILQNGFEKPSDLQESHSLAPQMKFLIGTSLDTRESLRLVKNRVSMPLVVQTSRQDHVLHTKHGQALAEEGRQQNFNVLFLERDGSHSDYIHHDMQQTIFDFINENLRLN